MSDSSREIYRGGLHWGGWKSSFSTFPLLLLRAATSPLVWWGKCLHHHLLMSACQILLWTWSACRKLSQKITPGVSRTSWTSSNSSGLDSRLSEILRSSALKSDLCCDILSKGEAKPRAKKANTALCFGKDPKTCPKCLKTRLSCVVERYEQESTEAQGHEMWTPFLSQLPPSANKSLCLRTKPTFSPWLQLWRPGPLSMGIAQSLSHGWLIFFLHLEYI